MKRCLWDPASSLRWPGFGVLICFYWSQWDLSLAGYWLKKLEVKWVASGSSLFHVVFRNAHRVSSWSMWYNWYWNNYIKWVFLFGIQGSLTFWGGGGWQGIRVFILTRSILNNLKMCSRKNRRTRCVPVNLFFVLGCETQCLKLQKKKKKVDSFVNRTEMCFG